MAQNITEVRLLSVPLENDYLHTAYFPDRISQTTWMKNHTVRTETNLSYQRENNMIRFPMDIDSIRYCNYVMYQNTAYTSKWFYAFITKMEYVNDDRTDIYIQTDVMQTWLFDYDVKPSFIEREHVANDNIGLHTLSEGLELGDYVCNNHVMSEYGTDTYIIVATTKTPSGSNVVGSIYNGIYSGIKYYAFSNNMAGAQQLESWLADFDSAGAGDAIQCMFVAPKNLVELTGTVVNSSSFPYKYNINDNIGNAYKEINFNINKVGTYTPKNKKLLSYPYKYLLVSNNNGGAVIYNYEYFTNNKPQFEIRGCICPGCSIRMIPMNYKGVIYNEEEGLNLGKFPALNWTSDIYTNWLTQNATNIGISLVQDSVSAIGGAALATTGAGAMAGVGMATNGFIGIANTLGEIRKASLIPPQAKGNINCGDVITADAKNDFHFYEMNIKVEYAMIIDKYFDMFGYKICQLKTPEKNHRKFWWFTKALDINIDGNIPNDALQEIKNCYNRGITFWNVANGDIGDYNHENIII